jgi:AbrB family looped-hinge helix DNA binding protein
MQESVVSVRGQTVIPKEVREALGIKEGTKLRWRVRNGRLIALPDSYDPVEALVGVLEGKGSTEDLLRERREERDKEERALEEEIRRRRAVPETSPKRVAEERARWRSTP